jgi:hypothetical protein
MARRARPNGSLQQPAAAQRELDNPGRASIGGTTAGHNAGNRADMIRDAKQKLDVLQADIEKLNSEKKVKTKARVDIFRDLKSDLSMKREDVEAALRLAGLDGAERDSALDTIREIHAALGIGEQVDMIDALTKAAGARQDDPTVIVDPLAKIYFDAWNLGHDGKGVITDNPFDEDAEPEKHVKWADGWTNGQATLMAESPLTGGAPATEDATAEA